MSDDQPTSHPLSSDDIKLVEETWVSVQEFGLQKAGIVMFKRLYSLCKHNISLLSMCYIAFSLSFVLN